MSYRFNLYSVWVKNGQPKPHESTEELIDWLGETIHGRWWFETELTTYEYDTGQSEYTVSIFYEDARDAFLHRLRW
jgi:hypothetical protein